MPLQMNGVEAWITMENKVGVHEYAVDLDEDAGVATCWITGEPGQVSRSSPFHRLWDHAHRCRRSCALEKRRQIFTPFQFCFRLLYIS